MMLPRWVELFFMVMGAMTVALLTLGMVVSVIAVVGDWRAQCRRRRQLVENLIYASRTGSRWILVDEPKGRG